jgi:hypothetical protein
LTVEAFSSNVPRPMPGPHRPAAPPPRRVDARAGSPLRRIGRAVKRLAGRLVPLDAAQQGLLAGRTIKVTPAVRREPGAAPPIAALHRDAGHPGEPPRPVRALGGVSGDPRAGLPRTGSRADAR